MNNLDFTKDLSAWNEVAPEGATHYDPGGNGDEPSFMKYDNGDWLWADDTGFFEVWDLYGATPGSETLKLLESRVIPKPSAEQGLVTGEVYDVTYQTGYYAGKATLLGMYKNFYWLFLEDFNTPQSRSNRDVTLTKPDPEREKWIKAVVDVMADKHLQNEWQVAEVIYDAGLAGGTHAD